MQSIDIVAFARDHTRELLSIAAPTGAFLLNKYYKDRPNLTQSMRHSFTYLIEQPLLDESGTTIRNKQTAQVASLSIFNSGREAATKIEIVFNWEPAFINFWPSRYYEKKIAPDGRCSFFFDNLAPKDVIGLELLAINADVPQLLSVRSEQSVAKIVTLTPQPVLPKWVRWTSIWLAFAGIAMTTFIILTIIQLVAHS